MTRTVSTGRSPAPVLAAWLAAKNPERAAALEQAAAYDFESLAAARAGETEWADYRRCCAMAALERVGVCLIAVAVPDSVSRPRALPGSWERFG